MKTYLFNETKKVLRKKIEVFDLQDHELRKVISNSLAKIIKQEEISNLDYKFVAEIEKDVFNSIRGFGILDKIKEFKDVNEIMINGTKNVFYEQHGKILEFKDYQLSQNELSEIISRIASKTAKSINTANPIMDTKLADGSRINVVLPPLSLDGPIITMRIFNKKVISIKEAISLKTITKEAADFIIDLVRKKYNIIIAGSTSSGKTTFLNMLSEFIPDYERIITIEDTAELTLKNKKNLVRLETRKTSNEELNITIRDLIRNALRMRPDRIIVGEVRGVEAIDMLQAMNTGHDGSISTIHANSCYDAINRLEMLVLSDQTNYPIEFVQKQITSAIDIIIHLRKSQSNIRQVVEVSELVSCHNKQYLLNPIYVIDDLRNTIGLKRVGELKAKK
jgi:pilus assembly protein CpaF